MKIAFVSSLNPQEHIIRDVYSMIYDVSPAQRTTSSSNFRDWLGGCIVKNKGVDMRKFNQGVSKYVRDFQKSHSNYKKYQGDVPSDYDYNWEEMFYLMGIRTY